MFDIKDQIKFFGVQPRRLDRTIQLFGGALSGGLFMLFSAAVAISAFQLISGVCNYKKHRTPERCFAKATRTATAFVGVFAR